MAYWAQLIMIILTTPLSFLLNKFWTFKHDHLEEDDLDGDPVDVRDPRAAVPDHTPPRR